MLVLTTIGAKTGQERHTPLACFPDGPEAWLIVASKGGSATTPGWLYNLAKNPDRVWAQVGNRHFKANVTSLEDEERSAAYQRVVKRSPQYAGYEKKTDRASPKSHARKLTAWDRDVVSGTSSVGPCPKPIGRCSDAWRPAG